MASESEKLRASMQAAEPTEFSHDSGAFVRPDSDDGFPVLSPEEQAQQESIKETMRLKPIQNEEDAQRLRDIMIDPAQTADMNPDDYDRRMRKLREWRAANPKPEPITEEAAAQEGNEAPNLLQRNIANTIAIPDVAMTFATGAIAEIPAGIAGLVSLAWNKSFDDNNVNDQATDMVNIVRDMFTWNPLTARGSEMIQSVAAPIMSADNKVRDISDYAANLVSGPVLGRIGENQVADPAASTAIYTTIMGGLTIGGAGRAGGTLDVRRTAREVARKAREIKKYADEKGIILKQNKIVETTVQAMKDAVPETKAAHALAVRDALRLEKEASSASVRDSTTSAAKRDAMIDSKYIEQFGTEAGDALIREGFDLPEMAIVQGHLDALRNIKSVSPISGTRKSLIDPPSPTARTAPTPKRALRGESASEALNTREAFARATADAKKPKTTKAEIKKAEVAARKAARLEAKKAREAAAEPVAASLSEMQRIRDRLDKSIVNSRNKSNRDLPDSVNEGLALRNLRNQLDDFMDNKFTKDLMGGDPAAVNGWKQANAARVAHNARWNKESMLARLSRHDATATEVQQLLRGLSAVGPKGSASRTLRQIKDVLGKDHHAVKGITADFAFDLVRPLMQNPPNLNLFLRNMDNAVMNDTALMRELGMEAHEISRLKNFVRVAAETPSSSRGAAALNMLPIAVSRFTVGHGIAKAGLKVSMMANLIKLLTGKDQINKGALIRSLTGNRVDLPIFTAGDLSTARIARDAFLVDWESAQAQGRR